MTVLSIDTMAGKTRYARTAMLEVLKADYVTTARAKGLSEQVVILRHGFRNALIPLITVTMLRLPGIFGGTPSYRDYVQLAGHGPADGGVRL